MNSRNCSSFIISLNSHHFLAAGLHDGELLPVLRAGGPVPAQYRSGPRSGPLLQPLLQAPLLLPQTQAQPPRRGLHRSVWLLCTFNRIILFSTAPPPLQWFQKPFIPIRAVFTLPDFKSQVRFLWYELQQKLKLYWKHHVMNFRIGNIHVENVFSSLPKKLLQTYP